MFRVQLALFVLVISCCLGSCGSPLVFYTDPITRQAAPELLTTWKNLPPWENARSIALGNGDPLNLLQQEFLRQPPKSGLIVVSFVIPPPIWQEWKARFPKVRWIQFLPARIPMEIDPNARVLTINRLQGWRLLAKEASKVTKRKHQALIIITQDTPSQNIEALQQGWRQGPIRDTQIQIHTVNPRDQQSIAEAKEWIAQERNNIFLLAGEANVELASAIPKEAWVHGEFFGENLLNRPGVSLTLDSNFFSFFLSIGLRNGSENRLFLPIKTITRNR